MYYNIYPSCKSENYEEMIKSEDVTERNFIAHERVSDNEVLVKYYIEDGKYFGALQHIYGIHVGRFKATSSNSKID